MSDRLRVRIERDGRVSLAGELDIATVPALEEALADLSSDGASLVLELAELTFMDSTGLRAFVRVARQREAVGRLVLRGPTGRVLEVLDISGVIRGAGNLEVEHDGGPEASWSSSSVRGAADLSPSGTPRTRPR